MKKWLIPFFVILFTVALSVTAYAASVDPIGMPGNDIQDQDLITPPGCVFYTFGDNEDPGTYTVRFNCAGQVDSTGELEFSITIGTAEGNEYTEVLSWVSNFPVYAVIVKGGNAYNLYIYDTATGDTNLVSPINESGHPADVSHTSIIICPPLCPTPTPTPTPTPGPTTGPIVIVCGGCSNVCLCILWSVITLLSLIIGILAGCAIRKRCCHKHCKPPKPGPCDIDC